MTGIIKNIAVVYPPLITLVRSDSDRETSMIEGERGSQKFWDKQFSVFYFGNTAEDIIVKLVPWQVPSEIEKLEREITGKFSLHSPRIRVSLNHGPWQEKIMHAEGLQLTLKDRFKVDGVIYGFKIR